jgi:hypothetical protein
MFTLPEGEEQKLREYAARLVDQLVGTSHQGDLSLLWMLPASNDSTENGCGALILGRCRPVYGELPYWPEYGGF